MNFNENDLWRDKTKLLNRRFSKLHSAKVLLKLEFDTKDQVLFMLYLWACISKSQNLKEHKLKSIFLFIRYHSLNWEVLKETENIC